jgi:RTA1 like protein
VYRLIEFALGFHGYPFTHEWIFYVLESVPMLFAVSILAIFFPGKHLPNKKVPNRGIEGRKEYNNGSM